MMGLADGVAWEKENPQYVSGDGTMPPIVQKARDFAIAAHGDQKYGDHPYVYHLDAVHEIVRNYGDDARVVAYLHDVVEDTKTKIEQIEDVFGDFISTCVWAVTDEPGKSRNVRKEKTNLKLKRCGLTAALTVKAADRLANMRESIKAGNESKAMMYGREYLDFKDAVQRPNRDVEIWDELDDIAEDYCESLVVERLRVLESLEAQTIQKLRTLKDRFPHLKEGFAYCPGGILNAYREGNISFDEAAAHLKECNTPAAEARRVAITALEVTLKKLKAGA